MTRANAAVPTRSAAWRVMAAVLLAALPLRAVLAQQPAGASGSVHAAAPSSGGKAGNETKILIGLPSRRATIRQDANSQAPHFLKMTPPKDRPLLPAAPNVSNRNAIGVAVQRHDAAPVAPLAGHGAVPAPAPQSAGGSGLALRGREVAPVRVPGAQPLVSSRTAIGGASFTRPSTALLPLGGPAKGATTGINGTGIRPKH